MTSETFLKTDLSRYFLIIVLILGIASCAPRGITPSPDSVRVPIPDRVSPEEPGEEQPPAAGKPKPGPRVVASLQLTKQARSLIEVQQADKAIRILERAVAIDPLNGQNYFYLSEAWLIKGDVEQAANFNELAAIHLSSEKKWQRHIADQEQRIKKLGKAI